MTLKFILELTMLSKFFNPENVIEILDNKVIFF